MAFSKAQLYPAALNQISDCGKAIAHPARISILIALWRDGPMTVNELLQMSPLSRQAISQHLKILRINDYVHFTLDGIYIQYHLNTEVVKRGLEHIIGFYDEMF